MTSTVRSKSYMYLYLVEEAEKVLKEKYPEPLDYKELARELKHDKHTILKTLVLLALQGKIKVFPKENGLLLIVYNTEQSVLVNRR